MKTDTVKNKYYIIDALQAMYVSYTTKKDAEGEWDIIIPLKALTKTKHNILKDLAEFNEWTYKSYKNYIRLKPKKENKTCKIKNHTTKNTD